MNHILRTLLSFVPAIIILANSSAQVPMNWTRDEINPGEDFTLFQDNSVFTEGQKSLHMQLNKGSVPYLVSDIFYIQPGAEYEFSIDVLDNDTAGQVKVYADFYDTYGFDIFGEPPVFSTDSSEWVTIKWSGIIPSQAVVGYILIKFYNQPDLYNFTKTAHIWLDNVRFRIGGGENLVTNGGFEEWMVGMMENPGGPEVKVFPNPADEFIIIEMNDTMDRAGLYNSAGQLARSVEIRNDQATMDVDGLAPGIYLLKVESGNEIYLNKIIIRHY